MTCFVNLARYYIVDIRMAVRLRSSLAAKPITKSARNNHGYNRCPEYLRTRHIEEPNAEVSGAGTASAGLPCYAGANDGERK